MNAQGFNAERGNYVKYENVRRFIKNMISRLGFNGIIEFEFLIDHNNTIHFMECNPRISGSLRVQAYFDWVIVPYIKAMHNYNQFDEWNLDDQRIWKNT